MKKTARKDAPKPKGEKPVARRRNTPTAAVQEIADQILAEAVVDADLAAAADVQDIPVQDSQNTIAPQAQETTTMLTLKLKGLGPKGEARYISTDDRISGLIVIGRNLVATGFEFPAELGIEGLEPATPKDAPAKEPKEPKVKLTPEEKLAKREAEKAARAAMTPQERLDAKEAQLRKQAENLAARKAKIAAASAAAPDAATM